MKYVPEDSSLLKNTHIKLDTKDVDKESLYGFIDQNSNSKFLGFWRMKLQFYSASKPDTTKWSNRWLRKIGEPPVIYDSLSTFNTARSITKELANRGYYNSKVEVDVKEKNRQVDVTYSVKITKPYRFKSFEIDLSNDTVNKIIASDARNSLIKTGDLFNSQMLDNERERVVKLLRNNGYYYFQKELLTFVADSNFLSNEVAVKTLLIDGVLQNDSLKNSLYTKKTVRNVTIYNFSIGNQNYTSDPEQKNDTIMAGGYSIIYDKGRNFSKQLLLSKIHIDSNAQYSDRKTEQTYSALNALTSIKRTTVNYREVQNSDSLDCLIFIQPDKLHGIAFDVEGTNSDGNFGVGAKITYTNKNIFKGSEEFRFGINGAYEAMGKVGEIYNSFDIGANTSIRIQNLLLPFTKPSFRRKYQGTTDFSLNFNYQIRPDYTRVISNIGMKYNFRVGKVALQWDLVDMGYVYLPNVSTSFSEKYLDPSSTLRFSYEDHLIMRMGLGASYSTKSNSKQKSYYTVRGALSSAGNLLYAISRMAAPIPDEDEGYKIFNTRYSQFAKGSFDFAYNQYIADWCRFVYHAALGVVYPYGNATIVPYEERFFSGGANSVRGWSVRSLGPGSFRNNLGYQDYMIQSGDIKLDLNMEARMHLIWKLEGALFLDAGNIWTIKDYADQPGGLFKFNEFYKQIALGYGLGIRADFTFFVIRLDMGIKLYDPSYTVVPQRWRTFPGNDDFAFHFAIGYPF